MNKKELIELVDVFRKRKIAATRERQGKQDLKMRVDYVNRLPGVKGFQAAYEAFDSALTAMGDQIPAVARHRYYGIFNFIDGRDFAKSAKDQVMDGITFCNIPEFGTMYEAFAYEIDAIEQEYAKVTAYCKTLRDGKAVREYLTGIGFDVPEDRGQLPALPVDTSKLFL